MQHEVDDIDEVLIIYCNTDLNRDTGNFTGIPSSVSPSMEPAKQNLCPTTMPERLAQMVHVMQNLFRPVASACWPQEISTTKYLQNKDYLSTQISFKLRRRSVSSQ